MVQLAVARLAGKGRRIGMLASPAVRLVGLYRTRMEAAGFEAVFPDATHEEKLLGVIKAVKAGQTGAAQRQDYAAVARRLLDSGADALLVACTELSVLPPPESAVPVVDALDVLVEATIAAARGA
jgi:aspartate racemase